MHGRKAIHRRIDFSFPLGLSSIVRRTSIPTAQQIKVILGDDDSDEGSSTSGIIPSMNTNADYTMSLDQNKEINSYDTIDALPHVDHYRNLFSITSPEPKSRPTLEALHETSNVLSKSRVGSTIDFNNEMITALVPQIPADGPSQGATKTKVDVVKFGWIVGVLVSSQVKENSVSSILLNIDSLRIEYLRCDAFSSFILGDWTSWNWFSNSYCTHIDCSDSFNSFIDECDLHQWRSERRWNVLFDFP